MTDTRLVVQVFQHVACLQNWPKNFAVLKYIKHYGGTLSWISCPSIEWGEPVSSTSMGVSCRPLVSSSLTSKCWILIEPWLFEARDGDPLRCRGIILHNCWHSASKLPIHRVCNWRRFMMLVIFSLLTRSILVKFLKIFSDRPCRALLVTCSYSLCVQTIFFTSF